MTFAFIFISGFILAYTISNKLTILEKLALSFPLGFGIASMSMFKADFLLGKISISNLHLFLFITQYDFTHGITNYKKVYINKR